MAVSNAGTYALVVSNNNGSASSSNAALTVITPPQNQTATFGGMASFNLGVAGLSSVYQWQKEAVNLSNATNSTLTISNVAPANVGNYRAIISQGSLSITSAVATLALNPVIKINGNVASSFSFTNVNSVQVSIVSTFPGASIFYTLDNSSPDFNAAAYSAPFTLTNPATLRAVAYDTNFNAVEAAPVSLALWFLYTLNVANPGGGSVSLTPPGGVYRNDAAVQAVATASNGWSFQQWSGDAGGVNPTINVSMERAKTIQATFVTTVSAATNQNGVIRFNPALPAYPHGSLLQISAFPNPGYYFALWGGNASGNTNPFPMTVTNPISTVSALFAALGSNQFSLTLVPNGNGNVAANPRANLFTNGQSVTITASPQGTNKFLIWSGDANTKTNPLTLAMNSNKVITANFTGGSYPVRFNPVAQLTNGLFQFSFSGEPGRIFRAQTSTNLINWSDFLFVTNNDGTAQFTDGPTNNTPQKLYRAVLP